MNISKIEEQIKFHEEEVKRLKQELSLEKGKLVEERKQVYAKIKEAIERARMTYDRGTFLSIAQKAPYGVYLCHGENKVALREVWYAIRKSAVMAATFGRHESIYNKKTGEVYLTKEELDEVRKLLKIYTQNWCDQWAP